MTKVVILLLDGFRWDYLNSADTPFLCQAKNQGVCVERLATTFGFTQSRAIFAGSNRLGSESFSLFAFDPANSTFDFVRTDPRIKTFAKANHWWHSLHRLPFGRGLARRFEDRFQKRSSSFRNEVVDQARRKIPYAFAGHIPFAVLNHLRINYTGAKVHEPDGLPYESIFDCLREASVKFAYLMHPEINCDDDRVVEEIINSICSKESQVIFAQLSEADSVVHTCGPSSNLRRKVVGEIERKIRILADALPEDVVWVVFGDHGMTDIDKRIDAPLLLSSVESRKGARLGRDYLLFLDATIARFCAISDLGRTFLGEVAQDEGLCSSGEFLDEKKLLQMGVTGNWREIADLIWLANNGAILDPNYLDGDASGMCGMHGYSPQFSDMDSLFLCWGPGIPRLTIQQAQLTSVCRTICDLVGIHAPGAAAPGLY
ncbi:MAG: alkaline phosphatase family protein [Planctomycetota bacterium]